MMKKLRDIFYGVSLRQVSGSTNTKVSGICFDSRKAAPGVLFVAVGGTEYDGHAVIDRGIDQGATAVLCE